MQIFLCISKKSSNFATNLQRQEKKTIMSKPIFIKYNTPQERAEAFRKMIHLREEWEEHVRQREIELGLHDEAVFG